MNNFHGLFGTGLWSRNKNWYPRQRINCWTQNNYTSRNELWRVQCFLPVLQSVMQSVSQSISPVFLVSANPFKPLNRISKNFVVMKYIMCRCAYLQEILIQFFFLRVTPFFNLEIWPKWKILLKQFFSATPLKLLNRISWNFVVVKDIPCRCA